MVRERLGMSLGKIFEDVFGDVCCGASLWMSLGGSKQVFEFAFVLGYVLRQCH